MSKYSILLFSFGILFFSCKEETVRIPPLGQSNTGSTNSERTVFVEEFTGVKCVNCPDGAAEIENLKTKYKERLVAVSIHAGFFAKKLAESKFDFKTPLTISLLSYLGEPDGYPALVINRKSLGTNGNLVVIGLAKWAGLVQTESEEQAKAAVVLQTTYNATTRELKASTTITPSEALSGEYHLSIMLTESNIVDAQTMPKIGVVTDYKHKHVLRDMLTPFDGVALTETLSKGAKIKRDFTYTLPATFNAKECEIIAVLHKVGQTKEVLQAASQKIQ
jgi:hypothetical protein